MAEVAKRLITVEEYMRMGEAGILSSDDHVELIDGEIFEKSPVGSKHASVVKKLVKLLHIGSFLPNQVKSPHICLFLAS